MSSKITKWLLHGRVGMSSVVMATIALGETTHDNSHPHDPDDLNRCLLLLNEAPEVRNHFAEIAKLSNSWSALIDRWDEIEATFLEEAGLNWVKSHSAEKTYKFMREILDNTEKSDGFIKIRQGVSVRVSGSGKEEGS